MFEATLGHPRGRVVLRSHTSVNSSAWSPSGQLAVVVGLGRGARVLLDVGSPQIRTVSPHLPGLLDMVGGGPGGLMALQGSRAIGLLRRDGHVRTIHTSWQPAGFSPDGRSLLVSNVAGSRLGVMSLESGSITPVARVRGGVFLVAAWMAS